MQCIYVALLVHCSIHRKCNCNYSITSPNEHSAQANTPLFQTLQAGPKQFICIILFANLSLSEQPCPPGQVNSPLSRESIRKWGFFFAKLSCTLSGSGRKICNQPRWSKHSLHSRFFIESRWCECIAVCRGHIKEAAHLHNMHMQARLIVSYWRRVFSLDVLHRKGRKVVPSMNSIV